MSSLLSSMDTEVLRSFTTYATIVILKMMFMSQLTSFFRITRKVYANVEDANFVGDKKLVRTDPMVERVRRCHLNDLENIIPFVAVGLLYSLTQPALPSALLHFRLFVGSRFCHTVSYVCAFPQPSRGLSYIVGVLATVSMAYKTLSTVLLL